MPIVELQDRIDHATATAELSFAAFCPFCFSDRLSMTRRGSAYCVDCNKKIDLPDLPALG